MKLYKELNIDLNKENIISIVGGGGKTTSIKILSKELKDEGKRVLIATSTGIFIPERDDYDNLLIGNLPLDFIPMEGSITYYAEKTDDVKLKTQDISLIDEIIERNIFDVVLIEADGSKGLPIKAPAAHEPVISKYTTMTIGVIGLDSIGTIINEENVHRSKMFKNIVGDEVKVVDSDAIINLVYNENGLFKNSKGKKVLLLNKANSSFKIQRGINIRKSLNESGISIIISDIRTNTYFQERVL